MKELYLSCWKMKYLWTSSTPSLTFLLVILLFFEIRQFATSFHRRIQFITVFFSFLTILKVFGQTPLYFLCDNKWVLCPEVKLSQVGPLIHSFIHLYKENKLKVALISHNNYLYVPCSQRMEQGFYSGWHPSGWPCLNKLNFIITICYAQRSCSFRSLKPKVNSCSSYT